MFRVIASNVVMRLRHGHIIEMLRTCRHSTLKAESQQAEAQEEPKESERLSEFRKKLQETTDEDTIIDEGSLRQSSEEDPISPWPNNTNPHTGEIGGPKGPEPTRYGDWERKGRVTDF